MATTTQNSATETSMWKRTFTYLKAIEEASQFSVAERHAIRLSQRVGDLEEKVQKIELNIH